MQVNERRVFSSTIEGNGDRDSLLSTEDGIFASIPGIDDDDAENEAADTATASTNDRPSDTAGKETQAAPNPASPNNQDTPGTDNPSSPRQSDTPTAHRTTRADGLVAVQDETTKAQNLVDPKTGQVVVPAGAARRFYEMAQQQGQNARQAGQEVTQLRAQVDAYKQADHAGTQYGLNPEQRTAAMRIMGDFNRDPSNTLKQVVSELLASGVELPWLNETGTLNPSMIEGMIDRKFGPLLQERQASQAQERGLYEAKKELDSFLSTHQTATVHLPLIENLLVSNPGKTLQAAYLEIVEYAMLHGLDVRKPLVDQLVARNTGDAPSQPLPAEQAARQRQPLPNGRSNAYLATPTNQVVEMAGDASWDAIVQSLREQYSQPG